MRDFRRTPTIIPLGWRLPATSSSLPVPASGCEFSTRNRADRAQSGTYLALLPVEFARPSPSPEMRWALTPPFHPYPSTRLAPRSGRYVSVALFLIRGLRSGWMGVTHYGILWSSDFPQTVPRQASAGGVGHRRHSLRRTPSYTSVGLLTLPCHPRLSWHYWPAIVRPAVFERAEVHRSEFDSTRQ